MYTNNEGAFTIHRKLSPGADVGLGQLDEYFSLTKVAEFICDSTKPKFHVALQLPNDLLCLSVLLLHKLKDYLRQKGRVFQDGAMGTDPLNYTEVYLLCDNAINECCPDFITARHRACDAIIFFGNPCLTGPAQSNFTPAVFYVFPQFQFNLESLTRDLIELCNNNPEVVTEYVVLLSPEVYHAKCDLMDLMSQSPEIVVDKAQFTTITTKAGRIIFAELALGEGICTNIGAVSSVVFDPTIHVKVSGHFFPRESALRRVLISIGTASSSTLYQHLLFTYNTAHTRGHEPSTLQGYTVAHGITAIRDEFHVLYHIAPHRGDHLPHSTQHYEECKALLAARVREKFYKLQVIQNAEVVGICISSLTIDGYREMATLLAGFLRLKGKRVYTLYVGHPTPLKLGNFAGNIDCFVCLHCPNMSSLYFGNKNTDLLCKETWSNYSLYTNKPVEKKTTPSEVALGKFIRPLLSPSEVLLAYELIDFKNEANFTPGFNDCIPLLKQHLSNVAELKCNGGTLAVVNSGQLTNTNSLTEVVQTAQQRLASMSYQGLDPELKAPVQQEIAKGRHGIAKSYSTITDD